MLGGRASLGAAALLIAAAPAAAANPILDADFPDPAVLRTADGWTYAYATQSERNGRMINLQVARSRDLQHWEPLGDALPDKPRWAQQTQDFWAPHVITAGGRYYLYYSAKPDAALADKTQGLCLAVATAARPEGPFVDKGSPLVCGPGFVNIDPIAYDDPQSGKRLLYWGSGFGPIKVQELAADRLSFAPGSRPRALVEPVATADPRNYRRLVEGAWVMRRGGWYYLFFSGDNCCGDGAHYAVMVARSRSPLGPFVTRDDRDVGASVLLHASARWLAPGHNSVLTDARGRDWIVYHAIDRRRPREKRKDAANSRRVMLIDRIVWRNGWPTVPGGVPSP